MLVYTSTKEEVEAQKLQSIAGNLQHLAECVKRACVIMNRIITAIRAAPPVGKHPFDPDVFPTLEWFLCFTASRNNIVLLLKLT